MGSGGGRENCRAKAAGGSAGGGGRHLTPARERRGRCPCGQCWMRGPSAEAAPGRGAPRGGEAEARGRPEGHRAAGSSALAGCPTRSDAAGARRGPEPAPPAGGARTARRPRRSRRGAPGPPVMSPGRLRSAGAGASAATGGERRAEAWAAGGRREGRRKAERRGGRGGPGGGGGERERDSDGGRERGRQRAGREAARAAARAEDEPGRGAAAAGRAGPPDPPGHTVTSAARGPGAGRVGGREGAAGRWGARLGPRNSVRGAGAADADGPGRGFVYVPAARPPPLSCAPPPRRTPLGAPARPGLKFKSVQCRGGPPPACALPDARCRRAPPPPPSGLCPRPGALPGPAAVRCGARTRPGIGRREGGRGGAGGRPGSAVATAENGSLARPGPRAPPRPSPGPGGPARRGDPGGPRQGRGAAGARAGERGVAIFPRPPVAWGCGAPAGLGGARAWGACPFRGAHAPAEARRNGVERGRGGVEPGSSLPPLRAVGAGRRWWRRRRSVGAGREWAKIPGPGRGGLEGAGARAARLETTPVGMPGSPPAADSPCTHSHAPLPGRCRRVLESFASAQ